MDFITGLYLGYSFLAFYFLFLFVIIYVEHRKELTLIPKASKEYEVSCVIPCYNEEESIGRTIEAIATNGYKNLKRIIVVDDCSTDNSFSVMKQYEKRYKGLVMAVRTPKNTGNAAGAKNYGSKFVKTELIMFTDADSFPEKGSIGKMIGFFDNGKVGAVTASVLVKNRDNLLLRLQSIEYTVIKFTRKLLEFIDSIYVTPGPLAMYRMKYFVKVGRFDEKNMTEDIEITWRLLDAGYDVKMSLSSRVYSMAPDKLKLWFKQRIRWNIGGLQSIFKHKNKFMKKGMLGLFVLPFFVMSWVLGVFGLGFFIYRSARWAVADYLTTSYSIQANAAVMSIKDLSLNPDILFFFGIVLFTLSFTFTLISIFHDKEKDFKNPRVFDLIMYTIFYLLAYPVILTVSAYKMAKGNFGWR
jgi:cellulose synthase/poly-beta-1,6-N-acetylglucosamine synthase-like glycosyltransferase